MQTQFNKAGKADTKDSTPKAFWRKKNLLTSMVVLLLAVAPVEGGSYSSHFVVNDSTGTVYDTVEDLTWMKCEVGKSGSDCSGTGMTKTWQDAKNYCNGLNYGGRSNWTLPTVIQLKTIVNKLATTGPYIFTDIFPNTTNYAFWTSTENSTDAYFAWSVYFGNGVAYDGYYFTYDGHSYYSSKTTNGYFRCVSPGA